jgi:hypothetical protein
MIRFALCAVLVVLVAAPASAAEVEATIMAGVGEPVEQEKDLVGVGPYFGASVGARISHLLGVHGQLHWHSLNFEDGIAGEPTGTALILSVAPQFHLLSRRSLVDLVVGPTVGWFTILSRGQVQNQNADISVSGVQLGAAGAALFRVADGVRMGPHGQIARLYAREVCIEIQDEEKCDDDPEDGASDDFYSLSMAVQITF